MKKALVLCALLSQALTVAACQPPVSQEQPQKQQAARAEQPSASLARREPRGREWQAATYKGLTMGKATRADMLRVFGEPEQSEPFDGGKPNAGVLYFYKAGGEMAGDIVVAVDKRTDVVLNVEHRQEGLSKEQVIKQFGNDYIVTKYSFDECLGNFDSAPLYESPSGSVEFIEYRERSIAVSVEGIEVNDIRYVGEPIGAPSSKCKGKKQEP